MSRFALLTLVLSLFCSVAHAQWTQQAPLIHARANHTATLLDDGRVLVVSGAALVTEYTSACELFDPDTNTWSNAEALPGPPRQHHQAILLRNGRVLVTGGQNPAGEAVGDCHLFDPQTGTWSNAASLDQPRYDHRMVMLRDGTIVATGGAVSPGDATASCERFSPRAGRWSKFSTLDTPRLAHVAVAMPNGRVLVTGGIIGSRVSTGASEMLGWANRWRSVPAMHQTRFNHAAVALDDKRVLVVAGYPAVESGPKPTCEIFDLGRGEWTRTASLHGGASLPRLAVRPDGTVLVTGGYRRQAVAEASLFDPKSNDWTILNDMPQARHGHTATTLADGRVLIAGGFTHIDPESSYITDACIAYPWAPADPIKVRNTVAPHRRQASATQAASSVAIVRKLAD